MKWGSRVRLIGGAATGLVYEFTVDAHNRLWFRVAWTWGGEDILPASCFELVKPPLQDHRPG